MGPQTEPIEDRAQLEEDKRAAAAEQALIDRANTEDLSFQPPGMSDEEYEARKRVAATNALRGSQDQGAVTTSVPMQNQNIVNASGATIPGRPGGFNFSAYDAPGNGVEIGGEAPGQAPPDWMQSYMADQGVPTDMVSPGRPGIRLAKSGQTNVMGKMGDEERLGTRIQSEVLRKGEQDAADLDYAAEAVKAKATAEANLIAESRQRLSDLKRREAEASKIENELYKSYNTPAKVFHPATGGATGILGVLAGMTWALAGPEYQKNTIAMANTLIEQDLRNRQLEQQKLEGRLKTSNNLYERYRQMYKDQDLADDAFRAHLARSLADNLRAMGMKSQSAEVRERSFIMAEMIQNQKKEKAMEGLARFRTAPTASVRMPYFARNKEGKIIGRNLGRGTVGQVASEEDLATTTIGNKAVGVRVGGPAERNELMKTFAEVGKMKDMANRIAQEAERAAAIADPGQRAAALDDIEQRANTLRGQLAEQQRLGVLNGSDKEDLSKRMLAGADAIGDTSKRVKLWGKQSVKGIAGEDSRDYLTQIADKARGIATQADEIAKKDIGNRSLYQKHVERGDDGATVIGEAWVPMGETSVDVSGAGPMEPNVPLSPQNAKKSRPSGVSEDTKRKAVENLKRGSGK